MTTTYARKRHDDELSFSAWIVIVLLLFFMLACTMLICFSHGEEATRMCAPVERMDECSC